MKKTYIERIESGMLNHDIFELREDIKSLSTNILALENADYLCFEQYQNKLKIIRKKIIFLLNKKIADNITYDLKELDNYYHTLETNTDIEYLKQLRKKIKNNIKGYTYEKGIDNNYNLKNMYTAYHIKGNSLTDMIDKKINELQNQNISLAHKIKKLFLKNT